MIPYMYLQGEYAKRNETCQFYIRHVPLGTAF